jgi:hypothetical protein
MNRKDRIIIAVLTVWTFIHTYFLIVNNYTDEFVVDEQRKYFYPFADKYQETFFDTQTYDSSEFFVYVVGAWVGFLIYKFLKGSK